MVKFCPNCGTQLEDNTPFCSNCGTQMNTQTPVEPQPSTTKKPNQKKILIAVIASVVAIAAIVGILFAVGILGNKNDDSGLANTPESIVKVFLKSASQNNAEKAIDCYPSFIWGNDETRKEIYLSGIQSFIDSYPNLSFQILSTKDLSNSKKQTWESWLQWEQLRVGGFVAADITEFKTVEAKLTYTKNNKTETENITFTVIKFKNEWKILDFE